MKSLLLLGAVILAVLFFVVPSQGSNVGDGGGSGCLRTWLPSTYYAPGYYHDFGYPVQQSNTADPWSPSGSWGGLKRWWFCGSDAHWYAYCDPAWVDPSQNYYYTSNYHTICPKL